MAAVTADQCAITRATSTIIEDVFPIKTSVTLYVGALANFVTATGRLRSAAAETGSGIATGGLVTEIINDSGAVIAASRFLSGKTAPQAPRSNGPLVCAGCTTGVEPHLPSF